MLGEVFERFVEKSPVSVMVRGLLERVLNPEKRDALFYRTALKQYTRDLLFSTVFELLCQVVCGLRSMRPTSDPTRQSGYRSPRCTTN